MPARSCALVLCVWTGVALTAAAAEFRTWSDSSGEFSLEAELVGVDGDTVTLKDEDGKEYEIPVDKLSAADKKYLADRKKSNPFAPKSTSPFQKKSTTKSGMSKDDDTPAAAPREIDVNWQDAPEVGLVPSGDWAYEVQPSNGPWVNQGSLKTIALPSPPEARAGFKTAALNPVAERIALSYFHDANRGTGTNYVVIGDFKTGKTGAPAKVAGEHFDLKDLHNDGQRVLMVRDVWGFGNHERVEIWKLAGARTERPVSFVPYDGEEGGKRDVTWAKFLGDDRFATLASGQLVVWRLDPVEPLLRFGIDGFCTPAVSPDGRYLAVATNKDVALVDLNAGECAGLLKIPDDGRIAHPRFAFSPDGSKLGLLSWDWLYTWDLKPGQLDRQIFVGSDGMNAPLVWTSNDHVLVGMQNLIDLPNNLKLWQYTSPPGLRLQPLGADGWTVYPIPPMHGRPGAVVAARLPHTAVNDQLKKALADPNLFVLKPGATVKVEANGIADQSQRTKVVAALTEKLEANGCKVSDAAAVALVASIAPGKVEKLRFFGSFQEFDFPSTISKLQLQSGGQTVWEQSWSNTPFVVDRKFEESMEQALERHKGPNYGAFSSVQLPKYLTRTNAQGSAYLGATPITTAGMR
uniref:SLA1 homology domain-containing protein n=1 Tax=Schlesneria paludicola TaxID=360056 RepID=A0A7C2P3I6_9PLAN